MPNAAQVATWDSTVGAANTTNTLGADLTFAGIAIANPGAAVTINAGNTLTLGAATIDIDMTAATQDLTLICGLALTVNGSFNMSQAGGNNTTEAAITAVDLSGLSVLNIQAPAGSLSIGSNLRSRGTLTLANTSNTINVGTLSLGNNGSNSAGQSVTNLGAGTNAIQAPTIVIGGGKAGGALQFAGAGGSVVITGANGSGSSTITIGNANTTGFTPLPGVTNTASVHSVTWTKAASYTGTYGTHFSVETSATLTGVWAAQPSPGTVTIIGNNVTYTFPAGTLNFARLKVTGP